jgi:hypothetical protein
MWGFRGDVFFEAFGILEIDRDSDAVGRTEQLNPEIAGAGHFQNCGGLAVKTILAVSNNLWSVQLITQEFTQFVCEVHDRRRDDPSIRSTFPRYLYILKMSGFRDSPELHKPKLLPNSLTSG